MNKMLFPTGKTAYTPGAWRVLTSRFGESQALLALTALVYRHQAGDWGDIPPEDAKANDIAVVNDDRILSAYTVGGQKIWVITEWDRSVTTVLLPEEY